MTERGKIFLVTEEQRQILANLVADLPWRLANPIIVILNAFAMVREDLKISETEETKEQELPLAPPGTEEWR